MIYYVCFIFMLLYFVFVKFIPSQKRNLNKNTTTNNYKVLVSRNDKEQLEILKRMSVTIKKNSINEY